MIEQIKQIVDQISNKEVDNNANIDSNLASNIAQETGASLMDGLKSAISGGDVSDLMGIFNSTDTNSIASNPVVTNIIQSLSSNLGSNLGIDSATSSNFASSIIPKILSTITGGVKDGNFNITDLLSSLTTGENSFLDQNGDGKVDLNDAISAVTNGKLGDILGNFFKK